MCTLENPCGGVVYRDLVYLGDARRQGLRDTERLCCLNGHSFMVGAPPEHRGWRPAEARIAPRPCIVCGEPLELQGGRGRTRLYHKGKCANIRRRDPSPRLTETAARF
jgi:hypothetical protein